MKKRDVLFPIFSWKPDEARRKGTYTGGLGAPSVALDHYNKKCMSLREKLLLREEQEKRCRKHQRRLAILGEERAKEKQKQDDDRDEHLFKLIAEARAKREPKCQRRQIS